MEGTASPAPAPEAPAREATDPRRFTLAVVGAVGTGVSGLGFFIFVGGALVLGRFRGAGLPALTALSVVPRSQLLALGAASLVILLIFALAVVVLLMAAWPKIRSARARLGILSAIGVAALAFYVRRLEPRYVGETEHAVLLLAGVLVVIAGLALVYTLGERGLADARASSDRGQLLWFGIAALVTSAIFAALGAYVRQLNHPQVQAAAVLQGPGAPPIVGIYVGETGGSNSPNPNRVYVGFLSPTSGHGGAKDGPTGRLIAVKSPSVTAMAIGPSEPLRDALARGPRLLQELEATQTRPRPRRGRSP